MRSHFFQTVICFALLSLGARAVSGAAKPVDPRAPAAVRAHAFEVTVRHGKMSLSGVVTHAEKGQDVIFIHTGGGEWWRCSVASGKGMDVGDLVTVAGTVLPQTVNNRIDFCRVEKTGRDASLVPECESVTVGQLNMHPASGADEPDRFARLVSVVGRVQDVNRRMASVQIILSDSGKCVSVSFRLEPGEPLPDGLAIGAVVRAKGTYVYVTEPKASHGSVFTGISSPLVQVRTPADLAVLSRPPFWTPVRVWMAIGAGVFVGLVLILWVVSLRRTVARQVKVIEAALRERSVAEGERRERLRLSHDLHDDFQQLLSGSLFRITAALNWMEEKDVERARTQLEKARTDLVHTQSQLRAVLWGLKEESEGPSALVDLFRYAAGRMAHWSGKVEIVSSGREPHLARTIAGALLMILQEAVGNALKHGRAGHVKVHVDFDGERLTLRIVDDGCGFDLANHPPGLGLTGMADRASALGGRFKVLSEINHGTCIIVEVKV